MVFSVSKHIDVSALHPVCAHGGIDGGLHVTAVEIYDRSGRGIVASIDNTEMVVDERACI